MPGYTFDIAKARQDGFGDDDIKAEMVRRYASVMPRIADAFADGHAPEDIYNEVQRRVGSISEKGSGSLASKAIQGLWQGAKNAYTGAIEGAPADAGTGERIRNLLATPPAWAIKGAGETLGLLDAQAQGAHKAGGAVASELAEAAPWLPPAIPATIGMAGAELGSLQNWVGAPEAEAGVGAGKLGQAIMKGGDRILPKSFQYNPRNIAGQAEGLAKLGTDGVKAVSERFGKGSLPKDVLTELNPFPPTDAKDPFDIPAFQRNFEAEKSWSPLEPSLEVPAYIRRHQGTLAPVLDEPKNLPSFDNFANEIFEISGNRPAGAGPAGEASGEVTELIKRADRGGDQGSLLEKQVARQGGLPVDNNGVQAEIQAPREQQIGTPPAKVVLKPQRPRYVTVEGFEERGPAKVLDKVEGQTFEEVQFQDGSKMRLRGAEMTPAGEPPLPAAELTVKPGDAPEPVVPTKAPTPKPLPIETPKPTGKTLKNYSKQSFELLPDAEKAEVFNASSLEERKAWGKVNGMQEPPARMEAPAPVAKKAPEAPTKTTPSEIRSKLMQSADSLEGATATEKTAFEAKVRKEAPDVAAEFDASAKVAGRNGWWIESETPPPLDDTFNLTGMGAEEAGLRQMQAENPEGFARQLAAESKARQAKAVPEAEQAGLEFGDEAVDTRPEWQQAGYPTEKEFLQDVAKGKESVLAEARNSAGGDTPVSDTVEDLGGIRDSGTLSSEFSAETLGDRRLANNGKDALTAEQMVVALKERGVAPPDADLRWLEETLSNERDAVNSRLYANGTDKAAVEAQKKKMAAERAKLTKEQKKGNNNRGRYDMRADPFGFQAGMDAIKKVLNDIPVPATNYKEALNLKDFKRGGIKGVKGVAKRLLPVSQVMAETGTEARRATEYAYSTAKKFIDSAYSDLNYVRGNKARLTELWQKMEGNMDLRTGDPLVTEAAQKLRKTLDGFHAWTGRPIDQYRANYLPHRQVPGEGIQPLFKPWEINEMEKAVLPGETPHFRRRKDGAYNSPDIDLDRVLEGYFNRTAYDEVQQKMLPIWEERFKKSGKDIEGSPEKLFYEAFKRSISSDPRNQHDIDKMLDNVLSTVKKLTLGSDIQGGEARRITNWLVGKQYIGLLGGRLSFPVRNFAQVRNIFSEYGADSASGLKMLYSPEAWKEWKGTGMQYSEYLNEIKDRANSLSKAKNRGLVDSIAGAYQKVGDKLMMAAEFSENVLRGATYHAAKKVGAKKGLTGRQLELFAKGEVDKLQFPMGKTETNPHLNNSLGRLVTQFTTYPQHQMLLTYNRMREGQYKKMLRLLAFDGAAIGAAGAAGYTAAPWLGWEPISSIPHGPGNIGRMQERVEAMKMPGGGTKIGPVTVPKFVGQVKLPFGPMKGMARLSPLVQDAVKMLSGKMLSIEEMATALGVPALGIHEYQKLKREIETGYRWELKQGRGPGGLKIQTLVKTGQQLTPADAVMNYFKALPPSKLKQMEENKKLREVPMKQRKEDQAEEAKDRLNA